MVTTPVLDRDPRTCNTGVTRPGQPLNAVAFVGDSSGGVACRFDYYRASLDIPVEQAVDLVRRASGVELSQGRGMFSFVRGVDFKDDASTRASVFWSDDRSPLVQASGVYAQKLFDCVSVVGAERIRLARADVALDGAAGAFEIVDSVLREVALARNVETSLRGDWDTPGSPSGRTRYVGSRQSFRFRRLYEFAKCHGFGAPWRYELEVKPTTAYKAVYGAMSPIDVLRADDLSRRVLFRLGVDLSRLVIGLDSERGSRDPFESLAAQYWRVLMQACDSRGGDLTALGRDLMEAVERVRCKRERSFMGVPGNERSE